MSDPAGVAAATGASAVPRTTNINGPWDTQATLAAPLHGIIEYEDTNPPQPAAFHRTEPQ